MTPEAVASYLKQHPEFFEQYAAMLADVAIPHPHGGRAISLSERQILALRDKSKQLEAKLRELIQFGEENDALGAKVHRLALDLMAAPDAAAAIETLYVSLREDFAVPHVALRLWPEDAAARGISLELSAVSDGARDFAASLANPYCGTGAIVDTGAWFIAQPEGAAPLESYAYVALWDGERPFGLLALASEDEGRFYPEMGTLFLKRVGELFSAALLRGV